MRAAALALVYLLSCAFPAFAQERLKVRFLDVGQGDAVLIQSPSGQNIVYDGGEQTTGVRERLQQLGVASVDLVIASHNHLDHIGGLAEVVRYYRPRYYLDNGVPATTLTYRRLLEAVSTAGTQLLAPTARRISLGAVSIIVVPPAGIDAWGQNNNSMGVIVEYGSFRLSLSGDAEQQLWGWWSRQLSAFGPVQVHKASHHGSRNGDTAAGIALLSPEVVVISAGRNNQFGHPDADSLRLYAGQGAKVYQTDVHGSVLVEAERSGHYTVQVGRGEGARPPPLVTSPGSHQPSLESIDKVYVTRTGSKYHRANCSSLARSRIELTLAEASARYGPCGNCRPPVLSQKTGNYDQYRRKVPQQSAPPPRGRPVGTR